jgi:putative endonuclease
MESHVARGRHGETIAAAFLELRGYRILDRNYRFGHLEIDLVGLRGNVLVVVEVKFRARSRSGPAAGAVGPRKQRDLETAAVGYVKQRGHRGLHLRFDVVSLEARGEALLVRHVPGAFTATGRYRL